MFTAFIPFPTALLAEYMLGSDEERTTATVLYAGTLAVTAVFFTLLWFYGYLIRVLLYVVAFTLAFVSVVASLALILALALFFVLPESGDRRRLGIDVESSGASSGEQPIGRPDES